MQILALARLVCTSLAATAEAAAERTAEHIENIFKAAETTCTAHAVRIYACMTEPVVLTLFIGVRQNAVGFIDFLEFFFGFLVAGVLVGVILHGHLTKGLFDLLLACPFLQAKHFIVIAFFCHNKPLS